MSKPIDQQYLAQCTAPNVQVVFLFHVKDTTTMTTINTISVRREPTLAKLVEVTLPTLNNMLPDFLKKQNFVRFIPYRPVSIEIPKPNVVEFCYHFDKEQHDFIYNSMPGYVMQPTGDALAYYNELYKLHLMHKGWYDPKCNASG